jgi:membrane protein YqaA with SNARE-associated domain
MLEIVVSWLFEWIVIFIANIIPAFAPPPFLILSYFYADSSTNLFVLVFIGVTASTIGRYLLAKLSGVFTFAFASKHEKGEMDFLKKKLSGTKKERFLFSMIYSITPLPTNILFIIVGATRMRLKAITLGFAVGRTIQYAVLVALFGNTLRVLLITNDFLFIIVSGIFSIAVLLIFFLMDWERVLKKLFRENDSKSLS